MEFKYKITDKLQEFLDDALCEEEGIGCSDTQVIKITKGSFRYFLKMGRKETLGDEFAKLSYLQGKLLVPEIVFHGVSDGIEYLITKEMPGEMICSSYYEKNCSLGIDVIVSAFKRLYEVDITDCDIDVSLDYYLPIAEINVSKGLIKDENIGEDVLRRFGSAKGILKYLKDNKFEEELTFIHGDPSLPNIFADKGNFTGFIDVGSCGVGGKWFDIAIVIKSIRRNYGDEYVYEFIQKLGVEYDDFKYNYYMLLLDLLL